MHPNKITKEYIQKYLDEHNGKFPPKHNFPLSMEELYKIYHEDDGISFNCKVCNKPTSFRNFRVGFFDTCSKKCSNIYKKNKAEKYIVTDDIYSEQDFKKYILSILVNGEYNTKLSRLYLINNKLYKEYNSIVHYKLDSSQKIYDFLYGKKICKAINCNNTATFISFKEGYRDHCSVSCSKSSHMTKQLSKDNIVDYIEDGRIDTDKIIDEFSISISFINKFKEKENITTPNKKSSLKSQKEVEDVLIDILPDNSVITNHKMFKDIDNSTLYNINFHNRDVDIYVPEYKFGIEYNGVMFHSEGSYVKGCIQNIPKKFHLGKTNLCEEKGIQLFHIFENEWLDPVKQEIWKSIINSKLQKTNRIPARKTEIRNVQNKEKDMFLESNHLQGTSVSSINIGLYYENELQAIMTFGKSRFSTKYEYELLRFASKLNTTVIGGGSKLIKFFEETYKPKSLISYANRRWSVGNFYEQVGFNFSHNSSPNYFYFKDTMQLESRNKYQKHKLHKVLDTYDENKSESENMFLNGYRRIYDSGNKIYTKTLSTI